VRRWTGKLELAIRVSSTLDPSRPAEFGYLNHGHEEEEEDDDNEASGWQFKEKGKKVSWRRLWPGERVWNSVSGFWHTVYFSGIC